MDLPLPHLQPLASPVTVIRPDLAGAPLVFASAHSGRDYPAAFIASARLDALGLRRSEDCFVDQLFADVPALGMPLVCASFPRAYCDANREAWELDQAMFEEALPSWVNTGSARVGAGLGTIAKVVASGESIYRGKLRFAEAEARIRDCWQPFHDALAGELASTHAQFGACVLIDCHSMPASSLLPRDHADIVLGDAHGTACAPSVIAVVEEVLRACGFVVRRNDPYAGGYITRHYGRPRRGTHAVQIELNRGLYMDEARIEKRPQFDAVRGSLARAVAAIADRVRRLQLA